MTRPVGSPWQGQAPTHCDVCRRPLKATFVDGRTQLGPWAIMCPSCRVDIGPLELGTGRGQKYERKPGQAWVKTAG